MEVEIHFSSVSQPLNTTVACSSLREDDVKSLILCRRKIRSFHPKIFELTKLLEVESKLLDTFLYKNHNRFRNDKGYKTARMVQKTLRKMLDVPFPEKMLDFLQFVPICSCQQSLPIRLPTRAMSNYCQVLFVSAAGFLQKIDRLARKCGLLNMQRLNLGHFWGVAALCLGMISRVWIICKNLLCKLDVCYTYLGSLNQVLPGVCLEYDLPQRLHQLLDEDLSKFVQNSESKSLFSEDVSPEPALNVDDFLDIGEPVKRKSPVESEHVVKKVKVENEAASYEDEKKDCLGDIHSIEDFKKFLSDESILRKTNKKGCFTRKLSQADWKVVKKDVLSNLNPVIPNKSIKLCRKLIRKRLKD